MKKFRLLLSMLAATAVMFTACQPGAETPEDPNPDQGTDTPAVQVINWYAIGDISPAAVKGESMLLTDAEINLPGHYLSLSGFDWSEEEEDMVYARGANLFMVDFDFANETESYVYLTSHDYPVVATGGISLPTTSCLYADGMSEFTVGDKTYTVVAPQTETDADGNPYGVTVMSYCSTGMDWSVLYLNIPAVDNDGNPVVIVGQYSGPLGYNLAGGGQPSKMEEDLNLDTWRITNFTGKVDNENNLLVLKANGGGAFLTLNLWLGEDGAKEWANADGVVWDAQVDELDQPMGPLTGVFDNDPYYCTATTGGFTLYTTETEGQYLLVPHRNGGLKFVGEQIVYTLVRPENEAGGYTVTITMQE